MLNRGPITYESAINKDGNMFNKLKYHAANEELYQRLWREKSTIEALTRHHLGLGRRDEMKYALTIAPCDDWLRGGLNVCIPVDLIRPDCSPRRLLFRCPLPYKLAEAYYPGTVDEKLGCEVGTYAWMHDHCPDVRIPHLYGFGFSNGRTFTHVSQRPWYVRIVWKVRHMLRRLFQRPVPSAYTSHPASPGLSSAYILLERIEPETGQMLATTWNQKRHDLAQRYRLFRGIARTMLSLARLPQPRIGSFQFRDDGTVSLTNRPLTSAMVLLENDGAPRTIQRGDTYTCTESYASDLLTFHDTSFLHNPNAVFGVNIRKEEITAKTILRTLSHKYIRRESRRGPFLLQFKDLHIGNIFVDDDWNVTSLIDLEWVCALPAEQLAVPYWLTGRAINELDGEHQVEFDKIREEFMLAFDEEEKAVSAHHGLPLARIMRDMWESGGMWFWISLDSVNAAYWLVFNHLMPRFTANKLSKVREIMFEFWCERSGAMVERKVAEYRRYEGELKKVFGEPSEDAGTEKKPEKPASVGDGEGIA